MSTIEANTLKPISGSSTLTLGESGDTVSLGSGVTAGTGIGTTINNNADNRVITGSDTANTLEGESSLIFSGDALTFTYATNPVIDVIDSTNTVKARHQAGNTSAVFGSASDHPVVFIQGSGEVERMRINNEGELLLGVTSPITGEGILQVKGIGNQNVSAFQVGGDGQVAIRFFNSSGSGVGGINANTSSTTYNTSSDYRLKENEVAISDGITRLKQLKPYRFNFKAEPDTTVDGFFAHEVSSAVPEAITGTKDATETYTDDNGDEQTRIKPQGIDQSKLVPLLTSALQEAITKIETLEARVQALESA
jgi:hypothetical protein